MTDFWKAATLLRYLHIRHVKDAHTDIIILLDEFAAI